MSSCRATNANPVVAELRMLAAEFDELEQQDRNGGPGLLADGLDCASWRLRERAEQLEKLTVVHIVDAGVALCGRPGLPGDWPQGHQWVPLNEAFAANCQDCLAVARAPKKEKP